MHSLMTCTKRSSCWWCHSRVRTGQQINLHFIAHSYFGQDTVPLPNDSDCEKWRLQQFTGSMSSSSVPDVSCSWKCQCVLHLMTLNMHEYLTSVLFICKEHVFEFWLQSFTCQSCALRAIWLNQSGTVCSLCGDSPPLTPQSWSSPIWPLEGIFAVLNVHKGYLPFLFTSMVIFRQIMYLQHIC